MAFARYSEAFWFPNGALAAGIPARIFPLQSNALAPIFTDITGTVPLPNPLSTDGFGVLTFWAEEGEYWVHLDTEAFRISVGTPNTLDTFEVGSVAISSGIVSGGRITTSLNPTSIDIDETVGYVVDYATDDFRPTITRVHVAAQTIALDGPALLRTVTFWLLDSTGAFVQQAAPPTPTQRRTHIPLGFSALQAGVIFLVEATPVALPQPMNQMSDLMEALGPFSISGNVLSPNGVNLNINKSAGTMFSRSFNYGTTPQSPHEVSNPAQTPATFRYATRSTTVFPPSTTVLDVANYDVGGVVTPIPGGANVSTLQRVLLFALDTTVDQIAIQYGQTAHANLAAAADAAGRGTFQVNPAFIGTLIGYIAVTKTATDLSNPAQAVFIRAGKFAAP